MKKQDLPIFHAGQAFSKGDFVSSHYKISSSDKPRDFGYRAD
jgi:hypothetical protein